MKINFAGLERSRKILLMSIALLFISQFFRYSSDIFSAGFYSFYHRSNVGAYYYEGGSGWSYHGWLGGLIIALAAVYFSYSQRKLRDYWIVLPFIILLGFGGSVGGIMGFLSMLLAGYSIYLRRKEAKAEKLNKTSHV